jgi:hypothetical protein
LGIFTPQQAHGLRVKIFWSIPGHFFRHPFQHPEHGSSNRALYQELRDTYGADCVPVRDDAFYPDLPRIVRAQVVKRGVPERNVDLTHAYLYGSGVWTDGTAGKPRNLMVIARHS